MTILRLTLSLFVTAGLAGAASAQQVETQQPPAPVVRAHHHEHSPERQTRKLTRELGLSPDQASQVQAILAARQQQMQALQANSPGDPGTMRHQKHTTARDTHQKLDQVLTEPQRQQLAAMHREHKHHQKDTAGSPTV